MGADHSHFVLFAAQRPTTDLPYYSINAAGAPVLSMRGTTRGIVFSDHPEVFHPIDEIKSRSEQPHINN